MLYLLRLDGRVIAFGYALRGEGRVDLLKIGYDQGLAEWSPGRLLQLSAMQHEVERGFARTFHLGRTSAWKQRWSPRHEPVCRVWVVADTLLARALVGSKPWLRSMLRSQRGLFEVAMWLRARGNPADASRTS